jgi:hypothetical protein
MSTYRLQYVPLLQILITSGKSIFIMVRKYFLTSFIIYYKLNSLFCYAATRDVTKSSNSIYKELDF